MSPTATPITCPRCALAVQPDWDWCHGCGFDPEGLKPPNWTPPPSAAAAPPPAGQAPPPYAPPMYAPPTYAPPMAYGGPPPGVAARTGSPAATVAKVLGVVGVAFVALIAVLVLAVTFLGTTTPERTTAAGGGDPATVASTAAPAWTTWSPTDGSFVVEFPGAPITEPMVVNDPKFGGGQTAIYERGPTMHMLVYFDMADGWFFEDPQAAIDGALDGMASEAGITYSTREPSQFGFLPSQDFTGSVDIAGLTRSVQGVAFVSERRAIVMISVAVVDTPVEHDRFVGSFALR